MRYLVFFALPFALAAQSAEPDQRITQTLISEIQQLRLAIERSTLLNARTQLAISQLQMQEATVARLSQQLNAGARTRLPASPANARGWQRRFRNLEAAARPQIPNGPSKRSEIELQDQGEEARARTGERSRVEPLHARRRDSPRNSRPRRTRSPIRGARIAEMERALDAAIQQFLKQK